MVVEIKSKTKDVLLNMIDMLSKRPCYYCLFRDFKPTKVPYVIQNRSSSLSMKAN